MKRIMGLVLALVLVLGVITGCTPGTTQQTPADQQTGSSNEGKSVENVKLRMWTFLDLSSENARAKVLGKLIDSFEAENPGVEIIVETQEWSTMSAKVIAGHRAGSCPDIFMINMANLGEAIASGCMEPLENLFYNDWTDAQKADIDSELFRAGFDGKYHYEVPLFSGTFGIMYRADLFEEHGIKVEDIKTRANM